MGPFTSRIFDDLLAVTLSIKCPSCHKTLKAPATMAGKRAHCPNCKQPISIPAPPPKAKPPAEDSYELAPLAPDLGASSLGIEQNSLASAPLDGGPPSLDVLGVASLDPLMAPTDWAVAGAVPATTQRRVEYIAPPTTATVGWRYWLFSLALLPLAFSLLMPETSRETLERALEDPTAGAEEPAAGAGTETSPEPGEEDVAVEESYEEPMPDFSDMDLDELLKLFPDNRLPGAHLSRDSWMHWLYALLSAGLFFGLILVLFEQGQARREHLLGVGLLTATCGVMSLIMFQWFAAISSILRFGGIFSIFMLVVRLIGFSYSAAMDPENGFFLSLVGFTFGVGLCEEFIKAIPIYSRFRNEYEMDWRGACVWGLASGVGFGVAEGIFYSSDYYNGISGIDDYVVRFISCVALHAIWSGSVGILLWHHQDAVRGEMNWGDWGLAILKVQGVVMLLHGLYDTALKREMTGLALLTAIGSFGFLAWLIRWTLKTDQRPQASLAAARQALA